MRAVKGEGVATSAVPGTHYEKGSLLRQLDGAQTVVIRPLPLDAIEPDPEQPREYFDPEKLQELADSLNANGLLQEPAVYPVAVDEDGRPTRFRLLFGERRWRAARLAGWAEMRCKIVPSNRDGDLIARLRQIDQQEAENTARAALSAVEEARSIKAKLSVLRQMDPSATVSSLVEQLAAERKSSASTIWRLLDLLDAPTSLRTAILQRKITSRDLAFQLASHWSGLLKEHQAEGKAKREVQFRNRVREWADGRGLELNADALNKYAAENCLDPKMVKANVRTAEKVEKGAEEAFARVVARAIDAGWTVKDARRMLGSRNGGKAAPGDESLPLFERSETKGRARVTVLLDRLRNPQLATPAARAELAAVLRDLLAEVEGTGLHVAAACEPSSAAG